MSESIYCPVCGREEFTTSAHLYLNLGKEKQVSRNILQCKSCKHRFLPISQQELHLIEESYSSDYSGYREDPKFKRVVREEVASNFLDRVPPPASILDCGCGNGMFMEAAQEKGYDVQGIDVSEASARLCNERGLKAVAGDFLSYDFDKQFDFITMWDVVEHLLEPKVFMERAHALLKDKGWLVLKIPGFYGNSFKWLKMKPELAGVILGAPEHIQYFTEPSLTALLKNTGYENLTYYNRGGFREPPKSTSFKQTLKRSVKKQLLKTTGNRNLYVFAQKTA